MIVMKFGGTSVESAAAIERVASIVAARRARQPVVVVSAVGKTTNKLLRMAHLAVEGHRDQALRLLDEIHRDQLAAAAPASPELEREIGINVQELLELVRGLAILGELTPRSLDAVASYGERWSSLIVAHALQRAGLPARHVDARQVIKTDARHTQAAPLLDETYAALATTIPPLAKDHIVVLGGFIGSTLDGVTTTLGRGGSDFSAALVGAGIGASEIQIWTDVNGMLTADPRVYAGGHRVKEISFAEAAELAFFGAKVLHPSTVVPAVEKNIPVLILNSRQPDVPGTRITSQAVSCSNVVKSIACKRDVTLVNIVSTRMFMATGFLQRIFEVFARHETSVDMVATSEVSVSLTIDNAERLPLILQDLHHVAEVTVEQQQSIVCLVGDNIRYTPGIVGRVFHAIPDVNVRMISQGASLLNLSFVVSDQDLPRAVAALHDEFFRQLDPQVFEA